ncbi:MULTISPECIES: Mor transcription activator family protein [Vallitalea]|uniref:Uncharacterized protein n=1 Tax=Vallitalea maricola TaxID=3074433 RepID=A0ACB5UF65_9FIRM|nr:Mor transcription activator family protein [Vallitalea guaymasensis]GMQ61184.1 hypothetical protein AN2V17_04120 [Vallitalea sp. AN17-2]
MNNWTNDITIQDLDEKNKELAEIIGLDNLLELCKIYGGDSIYVNKLDELLKVVRDRKIKKEYNRYNLKEVAKKYNLTTKRIKQIVSDNSIKQQLSLFDLNI